MKPSILIIRLLEACNAGCFMCGFSHSKDSYRFSFNEAKNLSHSLLGTNIKLIRFSGGEPLIHPEIASIIATFANLPIKTSVITNGFKLPECVLELASSGLSQLIISIDGASPSTHDHFRKLPGLFDQCTEGIKLAIERGIQVRVNTVVANHNILELPKLYDLLEQLGVSQWSLIPLKGREKETCVPDFEKCRTVASAIRSKAEISQSILSFVGASQQWYGRNDEEIFRFFREQRSMTPQGLCGVVDRVLYYTPKSGLAFPCNCIPHRSRGKDFSIPWSTDLLHGADKWDGREWLREYGPSTCTGCDPANVSLGEITAGEALNDFQF